jgi:hypothetical protein
VQLGERLDARASHELGVLLAERDDAHLHQHASQFAAAFAAAIGTTHANFATTLHDSALTGRAGGGQISCTALCPHGRHAPRFTAARWGIRLTAPMTPRDKASWVRAAGLLIALGVLLVLAMGLAFLERWAQRAKPVLPPLSSSVTVIQPTPNVLLAVRDLARLEGASFHMERVIDLSEKQSHLFGLVEGEDAILLVAVADITAGVDLAKLSAGDVEADPQKLRARIRLPAPEILQSALDEKRTYVHMRRTSTLARRQEALETRARQAAERELVAAAREAGVLKRAGDSTVRVVEGLLRSLGYREIEVTVQQADEN